MYKFQYISEDSFYLDEYEDSDKLSILDEILKKGADVPDFDNSFVESLQSQLWSRGKLSPKQYNSLVRIYKTFKMDK